MTQEELKKRNIENLVNFYSDELISMKKSVKARAPQAGVEELSYFYQVVILTLSLKTYV